MSQLLGQNNVLGEKGFEDADRCQRHVTVPDREVGRQAHRPWRMDVCGIGCVLSVGRSHRGGAGCGSRHRPWNSFRWHGHAAGGFPIQVAHDGSAPARREGARTGSPYSTTGALDHRRTNRNNRGPGAPHAVGTGRPTQPQPNGTGFRPPLLLARCCCQLRRPSRALHGSQAVR